MKVIILAGGKGTRLWPLSQEEYPKQFVEFQEEQSLFQKTVLRFDKPDSVEALYVVSASNFRPLIEHQLQEIQTHLPVYIIPEPVACNTAPAIVLAAKFIQMQDNPSLDDVILVSPCDHLLTDCPVLWEQFALAQKLAKQGFIVTFGILPFRAETGYGYIKSDSESLQKNGWSSVQQFVEKPNLETATQFMQSGEYLWNSGMFAFTFNTLYETFMNHAPEIGQFLSLDYSNLEQLFGQMPVLSFDYAVMESTSKAVVVPLSVPWCDVGSWEGVYEIMQKNEDQNAITGSVAHLNTTNCLIFNQTEQPIATIGLDDLLIINTPNGLLIAKKGEAQQVRQLLEKLTNETPTKTVVFAGNLPEGS